MKRNVNIIRKLLANILSGGNDTPLVSNYQLGSDQISVSTTSFSPASSMRMCCCTLR
ncbi:MAG TPA: hypothetical protein VFC36_04315 [Paludibacter sp.]|nr:hypothetical protein [Paludibacter sp.]